MTWEATQEAEKLWVSIIAPFTLALKPVSNRFTFKPV